MAPRPRNARGTPKAGAEYWQHRAWIQPLDRNLLWAALIILATLTIILWWNAASLTPALAKTLHQLLLLGWIAWAVWLGSHYLIFYRKAAKPSWVPGPKPAFARALQPLQKLAGHLRLIEYRWGYGSIVAACVLGMLAFQSHQQQTEARRQAQAWESEKERRLAAFAPFAATVPWESGPSFAAESALAPTNVRACETAHSALMRRMGFPAPPDVNRAWKFTSRTEAEKYLRQELMHPSGTIRLVRNDAEDLIATVVTKTVEGGKTYVFAALEPPFCAGEGFPPQSSGVYLFDIDIDTKPK